MKKRTLSILLALAFITQLCFIAPSFSASAEDSEKITAVNALISALSSAKRAIPIEVTSWDNNTNSANKSGEVSADSDGTVVLKNDILNTAGGAGSINTAAGVFYSVTDPKAQNYDILIKDIEDIGASFSVGTSGYANTLLYILNKNYTDPKKGNFTERGTHFEATDLFGVNGANGKGGQLKTEASGNYAFSASKYYDVGTEKNWSNRADLSAWNYLNNSSFDKLYYQFAKDKNRVDFLSGDFTFYKGTVVWNDPEISDAVNNLKNLSGAELNNAVFSACEIDTSFMTNEEEVKNAQSAALKAFVSDKALYDLTSAYNSLYSIETTRFDMHTKYFAGDSTTESQSSDRYEDRNSLPDSENAPADLGKYYATKEFSYPTKDKNKNAFVINVAGSSVVAKAEDVENIYFWYHSDKSVGKFRFAVYYNGYNLPARNESDISIKSGWNRIDLKDYNIKNILENNDLIDCIRFQPGVVLESGESLTLTMGSAYFSVKKYISPINPTSLADAYMAASAIDTSKYENGEILENALSNVIKSYPALDLKGYLNNIKELLADFNSVYDLTISKYKANTSSDYIPVNESSYTFGTEIQGNEDTRDISGNQPGSIYLSLPQNISLNINEIYDISYDIKVSADATSSNILTYISNSEGKYIVRGDSGDLPNLDFIGLSKSDNTKLEKDKVKTVRLSEVYSKWNSRQNFDIFKTNKNLGDILVVAAKDYNASSLTLSNAKVYVGSEDIEIFINAANSCSDNNEIFGLTASLINYFSKPEHQFYSKYPALKALLDNFISVYGNSETYLSASDKVSEKFEIFDLISEVNISANKISDSENTSSVTNLNLYAENLKTYTFAGKYDDFDNQLKSFVTVLKNIKSVEKSGGKDFRDNSIRLFEALGGKYSTPGYTTGSYQELTVREMVRLKKYLDDNSTLIDKYAADVNSDGAIDSKDLGALADLILNEVSFDTVEFAKLYGENNIPYYNSEYASIKVPMTTIEDNNPYISMYPVRNAKGCIVLFPGGGYFQRGDSDTAKVAKAFNDLGYFAYICHYRVGDKSNAENGYRGNAILADGRRAIQIARANAVKYGYSSDKIIACGFSAGGHLAMSTSLHEQKENIVGDSIGAVSSVPNAVILSYAVTSVLKPATFGNMNDIFDINDLGSGEETRKQYVGANAATKNTPPTFIWYGTADTAVNPELNSIAYYNKLRELGVKTEIVSFEGIEHGVSVKCLSAPYEYHKKADKFLDEVFK